MLEKLRVALSRKKYRCCISRERYSIRQLCNGERVVIILHKRAIDELKFSFNFLHFEFRLTLYNMEYVSQNSPFSPIHIYIYPSCSVANQRETLRFGWRGVPPHHFPRHRLYDPLVFILSSLYTRGNFLLTRIYDAHDEEEEEEGKGGWLLDRWNEME